MDNLTLEQAREIADQLICIAKSVREYRVKNNKLLSKEEKLKLNNIHAGIIDNASAIIMISVTIALDDISKTIQEVNCITDKMLNTIKKLENIQQIIDLSTEILNLGTGILKSDNSVISKSIDKIKSLFDTI